MHFNPSRLLSRTVLCLCVVPPPSACQSIEPSSAAETASGTLRLPLVATSNGQRYRLRNASFVIEGPTPLVLDVERLVDEVALSAPLAIGSYELTLHGEWFLERLDASGAVRVDATLLSPTSIHFEIEASQTRAITLAFTTAAGAIGAQARLAFPERIASDRSGHLFLTDSNTVRQYDIESGELTTLVGGADGVAGSDESSTDFCGLAGIAVGSDGNVYLADGCGGAIFRLSLATRAVTVLAGSPDELGNVDGTSQSARFGNLTGLTADARGNLYVADVTNGEIRKITLANAEVTTLAGGLNTPATRTLRSAL